MTLKHVYRIPKKELYLKGTSNNYIEVPHSDSINLDNKFSIEILVSSLLYGKWVIYKTYGSYGYGIGTDGSDLTFRLHLYDGSTHFFNTTIPATDGVRKHIVFVVDRNVNTAYVYLNGVLHDTLDISSVTGSILGTSKLGIGANPYTGGSPLKGTIALVRIYNRVLSSSEVLHNYYNMDSPVTNGLVLWLDWTSIDIENGMWRDKSGYGNDGAIYGATPVDVIKEPLR